MPKKKTGRPSKLTPDIIDKIAGYLRDGAYIETASAASGISKDTLYSWLKQVTRLGTEDKSDKAVLLRAFSDAVEKAQADAELRDVKNIIGAADAGAWQASAWRLERKFPARWGSRRFTDEEREERKKLHALEIRKLEAEIVAIETKAGTGAGDAVFVPDSEAYREHLRENWGFDRAGVDAAANAGATTGSTGDGKPTQ